jgi:Mn2+/Fe2+ NRAMP family transporter
MESKSISYSEKIKTKIKDFGPAFFIIGYVVGTGSVTSMVVSGAKFGLSLSWALLLSCFFTYFLLVSISKLTIVTGDTLMFNFKKTFGKTVTIFIIAALLELSIPKTTDFSFSNSIVLINLFIFL